MRQIYSVDGNTQRLDGGAMFGNAPRPVWEKWAPPDDHHRIRLACRALLVKEAKRNILLEAGIGAFFEPKLRDRFGVMEADHVLLQSLAKRNVSPEQVDVVVLSHLHFDHAGGLLSVWKEGAPLSLVFPNAHYVVSEGAWERAQHPHMRDRASYIPELVPLLKASGRLEIVRGETSSVLGAGYSFSLSEGHTPGLLLTRVESESGPITFMGDLIPGVPWVHLPITMGYDRYPERLIDEKKAMLERVIAEGGRLFFTHDPDIAACSVAKDEKGKFSAKGPVSTLDGR